jgi:hypothetical protein
MCRRKAWPAEVQLDVSARFAEIGAEIRTELRSGQARPAEINLDARTRFTEIDAEVATGVRSGPAR